VAIWLPAPIGLAALAGLRRTLAGWTRADERPELRLVRTQPAAAPAPQAMAA
jgi:hypothetical protein